MAIIKRQIGMLQALRPNRLTSGWRSSYLCSRSSIALFGSMFPWW